MVQWLGLGAFTTVASGSIPGLETKTIPEAEVWQKKKKEKMLQADYLWHVKEKEMNDVKGSLCSLV